MSYKQIKTDTSTWMITVSKGYLHIAAMFNHPISNQDLISTPPSIYVSSNPPTDEKRYIEGGHYDEIHKRAVISWTHVGSYIFLEKELTLNIEIGEKHYYVPVDTAKLLSRLHISTQVEKPKSELCSVCKENELDTVISHCDIKANNIMCNSCASYDYGSNCLYCGRDTNCFFKMDLLHLKQKWAQEEIDDQVEYENENGENYYSSDSDLEIDI